MRVLASEGFFIDILAYMSDIIHFGTAICTVSFPYTKRDICLTDIASSIGKASRIGCVVRVLALPSGGSQFEPRS